jgi:hypothetical protein
MESEEGKVEEIELDFGFSLLYILLLFYLVGFQICWEFIDLKRR